MLSKIISATLWTYNDNNQPYANVWWQDRNGKRGQMCGDQRNTHMQALITRAKREGVKIRYDGKL